MDSWQGEVSALYSQYVHAKGSFFTYCCAELLERLPLREDVRVLDLAGGAGIMTRLILERQPTAKITILDVSEDQLAHARHVFGEKVEYVCARAERFEPAVSYDVIVCANAFWYLQQSIVPRLAAWLAPGGVLAFNLHEANTHFRDKSFFAAVHAEIDRTCRELHHTACIIYEATVDVDKLSGSLVHAGFSVHRDALAHDEPRENWHLLAELHARLTAPFMAVSIAPEAKLALYRQAFKTVTKERGEIERHSLLFVCSRQAPHA